MNKKYIQQTFISIAIMLCFLNSCKPQLYLSKASSESHKQRYELFAFDFTLEKKSIKERVRFLDSLGYSGVTFPVNRIEDIHKIDEYRTAIIDNKANFLIPAVFYALNPGNANTQKTWIAILNKLAGSKTDFWVIVSKPKNKQVEKEEVLMAFRKIANYADSLHLNVVIYPHDATFIESASEALWYIKQANCKNLFLTFHLCHELRAGNATRMNAAIAEVAPYIKLASICGADSVMIPNQLPDYWDDAIKPLYKGTYDTSCFLECLFRNGYKGPIALHTYGLKEPVDEHFSKSKEKWNQMRINVLRNKQP